MIKIRKSQDRGPSNHGWLKSKHTFSFANYYDPAHMGFESLRVINDDHVAAAGGFSEHPHENMEIISYVLDGSLAHKDSMGNGSAIVAGDVQRMSAGTGVTHSEFNNSQTEEVHFLQIWFLPNSKGLTPGYEQKHFSDSDKQGKLKLVVSNTGRDGSLSINQDVDMYVCLLNGDDSVKHNLKDERKVWLHVAKGFVFLNNLELCAGDGAAVMAEDIHLSNGQNAEVIIFDMAPHH